MIVDRGNFKYTLIDTTGNEIQSEPIEISRNFQYYPIQFGFLDNKIIGLYFSGNKTKIRSRINSTFFHISGDSISQIENSYISQDSFQHLEDPFAYGLILQNEGSFAVDHMNKMLYYSPRIYYGQIYRIKYESNPANLVFDNYLNGVEPTFKPLISYGENDYEAYKKNNLPGNIKFYYGRSEPNFGRMNSMDAGIFRLNNGNLVHFRA